MRLGWILVNGRNTASARLLGYNIHEWLDTYTKIDSSIISAPKSYDIDLRLTPQLKKVILDMFDVLVFQKVCQGDAPMLAEEFIHRGKPVVYIVDDMFPEFLPMCNIATVNVVSSGATVMADWVKQHTGKDSVMLWEAYETPRELYKKDYKTDQPTAVWFGTMGHLPHANGIRGLLHMAGFEYEVISAGPEATKQWSLDTVWDDILKCDLVVMPFLGQMPMDEKAKGTNRLIQSMALGMPCVASPYPAYVDFARHGKDALIAYNNDVGDWEMYLKMMRDESYRRDIGQAARERVANPYNIDAVAQEWMEFFINVHERRLQ